MPISPAQFPALPSSRQEEWSKSQQKYKNERTLAAESSWGQVGFVTLPWAEGRLRSRAKEGAGNNSSLCSPCSRAQSPEHPIETAPGAACVTDTLNQTSSKGARAEL